MIDEEQMNQLQQSLGENYHLSLSQNTEKLYIKTTCVSCGYDLSFFDNEAKSIDKFMEKIKNFGYDYNNLGQISSCYNCDKNQKKASALQLLCNLNIELAGLFEITHELDGGVLIGSTCASCNREPWVALNDEEVSYPAFLLMGEMRKFGFTFSLSGQIEICPHCDEHSVTPDNIESEPAPIREMSTEEIFSADDESSMQARGAKRWVIELLEEHYDDNAGMYKPKSGYDDAEIAKITRISEMAVKRIRREFFGSVEVV